MDCGSERVQRRAGYSTAAQQLLALVEWSAAWFGVAVATNAPLFLIRLTLQPESPQRLPCGTLFPRGSQPCVCALTLGLAITLRVACCDATRSFIPPSTLLGISPRSARGLLQSPSGPGHGEGDPQSVTQA